MFELEIKGCIKKISPEDKVLEEELPCCSRCESTRDVSTNYRGLYLGPLCSSCCRFSNR